MAPLRDTDSRSSLELDCANNGYDCKRSMWNYWARFDDDDSVVCCIRSIQIIAALADKIAVYCCRALGAPGTQQPYSPAVDIVHAARNDCSLFVISAEIGHGEYKSQSVRAYTYLSASEVVFHEEALYQVYVPLPLPLQCNDYLWSDQAQQHLTLLFIY